MTSRRLPSELCVLLRSTLAVGKRYQSTSVLSSPEPTSLESRNATSFELSTVLQELLAFSDRVPALQSSEFHNRRWRSRLEVALRDLRRPRKLRVALIGDHLSGIRTLVTALLDEPFSGSDRRHILQNRKSGRPLLISSDGRQLEGYDSLQVKSSWLNKANVDLIEVISEPSRSIDNLLDVVYSSDLILLGTSDARSLARYSAILSQLSAKPSTLLICNALVSDSITALAHVQTELEQLSPGNAQFSLIPFSSRKADKALQLLDKSLDPVAPSSPIDPATNFASLFTAAGVPEIADALTAIIKQNAQSIQTETVKLVAKNSSESFLNSIEQAKAESEQVQGILLQESQRIQEEQETTLQEMGVSSDGTYHLSDAANQEGRSAMANVLERKLAWWKMPIGGADDVTPSVAQASSMFYRSLERSLAFESGKLASLQLSANQNAAVLLTHPQIDTKVYHSSIMDNDLAQAAQKAIPITSETLVAPILARRQLLTSRGGPIESLQLRAQSGVLQFYSILFSSSGLSYATFMTQYTSWQTSVGLGLFGAALSAARMQAAWEKAKRRFMQNYGRVETGLSHDIASRISRTMSESVHKHSEITLSLVKEKAVARKVALAELEAEGKRLYKAADSM